MLIARDPGEPDAQRAAVAWLACASADGLRACSAFTGQRASAGRVRQLSDLHAHLVGALMSQPAWRPPIQVAFVVAALGELAQAAEPVICAEPGARGPVPSFERALAEAIKDMHPNLAAQAAETADADAAVDPVQATLWALEDVSHTAAAAAVLLHPGGVVGMPARVDDDR
jgi:hypothetical protein